MALAARRHETASATPRGAAALPRRVVILGASGFIGGRLQAHLAADGAAEVVGYSSADCNLLDAAAVRARLAALDLESSLVFCAAITRTVEDSFGALTRNLTMVENVLAALPPTGLRSLIFFSSVDVYGRPPVRLPVTEDTPLRPSEYYGVAKAASELLFRTRYGPRCPVTVIRIPGVYGPGDSYRSVIGHFVRQLRAGAPVKLSGNGRARRDFVEVGDVCRVVEHLLCQPVDDTLNVATGTSATIAEVVATAARVLGVAPQVLLDPTPDASGDLAFDVARLRATCPAIRFQDVAEGIGKYAAALRS